MPISQGSVRHSPSRSIEETEFPDWKRRPNSKLMPHWCRCQFKVMSPWNIAFFKSSVKRNKQIDDLHQGSIGGCRSVVRCCKRNAQSSLLSIASVAFTGVAILRGFLGLTLCHILRYCSVWWVSYNSAENIEGAEGNNVKQGCAASFMRQPLQRGH